MGVMNDSTVANGGFFFARKNNTAILTAALGYIRGGLDKAAGLIGLRWTAPDLIIADDCVRQYNALRAVFGVAVSIALCCWHFSRNLRSNLLGKEVPAAAVKKVVSQFWRQVYQPSSLEGCATAIRIVGEVLRTEGVDASGRHCHHR